MKEQISCRKVRRALQDALDRGDPVSVADNEYLTRFLPREVRVHLEHCLDCRDFLHSLTTFAPVLRNQLDEALRDYPDPEFTSVLQGNRGATTPVLSGEEQRGGPAATAFQRFVNWLFGPAGKPARVYR
jgi:hypothetical protein